MFNLKNTETLLSREQYQSIFCSCSAQITEGVNNVKKLYKKQCTETQIPRE